MINPTPVPSNNNPYRDPDSADRPRPTIIKQAVTPPTPPPPKPKRSKKRLILLTILSLVVAGATYGAAQFNSLKNLVLIQHQGKSSSILSYNPNDSHSQLDPSLFKNAGDGRFNLVVVGVGGTGHSGAYLTDSMQVLSFDTINKKLDITSVPRDLYVKVPSLGYQGKINAVYQLAEERQKGSGALAVREVVGNVLGVDISNFGLADFTAAKDIVDTLGGVDVNVPKALYDPLYPKDETTRYMTVYIPAGEQHMNGTTALEYARSRETTSDFDRSARQQLIIAAIKQKALSLGTLSNPVKVMGLINDLGQHLRTDMTTDQIQSLVNIYRSIPASQTGNHVLDTSASLGLLTATTDPLAGYIEYPWIGYNNYTNIHRWYQKNNPDPLLAREHPTITVVAGGYTTTEQAQTMVDTLNDYGYTATLGMPLTNKTAYRGTALYEASPGKKPFSHQYLDTFFSVTAQSGAPLNSGSDFELIYVKK
ncbi:LCP family protein [Patescibacteria group bacterium]|nr:LCP family protein [Patescibacteria group bacterium]